MLFATLKLYRWIVMHSMREMCHVDDMAYMTRAVEGFFRL